MAAMTRQRARHLARRLALGRRLRARCSAGTRRSTSGTARCRRASASSCTRSGCGSRSSVVVVVITYFIGRITRTLREREAALRQHRRDRGAQRAARVAHDPRRRRRARARLAARHDRGDRARPRARGRGRAPRPPSLAEDARLLRSEVERCRAILDRMSARAGRDARERGGPPLARRRGRGRAAARRSSATRRAGSSSPSTRRPARSLGARADFLAIVLPIVRNALDASPAGARVRVEVALARRTRCASTVRDEGHGMERRRRSSAPASPSSRRARRARHGPRALRRAPARRAARRHAAARLRAGPRHDGDRRVAASA